MTIDFKAELERKKLNADIDSVINQARAAGARSEEIAMFDNVLRPYILGISAFHHGKVEGGVVLDVTVTLVSNMLGHLIKAMAPNVDDAMNLGSALSLEIIRYTRENVAGQYAEGSDKPSYSANNDEGSTH